MTEFIPQDFATSLGAKLAARSRHVGVFLGAGAGKACGLPDVSDLQRRVLDNLPGSDRQDFLRVLADRNIEEALSRLRRIAALITGDAEIDGLTAERADCLDRAVCQEIVRALDIGGADLEPARNLAAWAARADYHSPLEIFTVNYDLLLETALESLGVPYFDGFVGNLQARFRTELVEAIPTIDSESVPPLFVRLWKLHGSVNWIRDETQRIVRIGCPVPDGHAAAIYPSDAKYEESRRVPFIVLQDRLRRSLYQPESLFIISGYSFQDAHLNELIFDAARRRPRSETVAFCHSEPTADLIGEAQRTPNLQVIGRHEAVRGGVRANWLSSEDELPNVWLDGELALTDFRHLASYLARSVRITGSVANEIGQSDPNAADIPAAIATTDA